MPPRLAHKKSRKGCTRCKARKVKCDEVRPACGSCRRHQVNCIYPTGIESPSSAKSRAGSRTISPQRDDAPGDTTLEAGPAGSTQVDDTEDSDILRESADRRLLEMRLMHHFINHAVYTFPSLEDSRLRDTWYNDVIPMAFEHDFLRNTILALSALHLMDKAPNNPISFRSKNPGVIPCPEWNANLIKPHETIPQKKLTKAYKVYLNLAFRQQREAVSRLRPEIADAICFASSLISMVTFRLLPNPIEDETGGSSHTLQWLQLLAALAGVVRVARPMILPNSPFDILLHSKPDLTNRHEMFFDELNAEPFTALIDFSSTSQHCPESPLDKQSQAALAQTTGYIAYMYRRILAGDPDSWTGRRILSFGTMAPRRFIELLEQSHPRAMVILAHYIALGKIINHFWCSHEVAVGEVRRIYAQVAPEWQWAMKWPLEAAGLLPGSSGPVKGMRFDPVLEASRTK